jgi:hypothetical protein
MIYTIETNISLRPLNMKRVATKIHCYESTQASGTRPTGKGLELHSCSRVVPPPIRADCISPTLVVEFTRAEKLIALMHHRLHFWGTWFDELNEDFRTKSFYSPHD